MLVGADSTGRGLRPSLAESWDISGDGLTYTFKIRDAKFNNGDPVTVDDVVFSLQSLAGSKRSMSFILKPVKSVEAMDDKHVKVTSSEPCAPMPSAVYASGVPEPPEPPKTPLISHPATTRSGPSLYAKVQQIVYNGGYSVQRQVGAGPQDRASGPHLAPDAPAASTIMPFLRSPTSTF